MKPTAAQARLLKALAGEGAYISGWAPRFYMNDKSRIRRVPERMVQVLQASECIEPLPFESGYVPRLGITERGRRLLSLLPERAFVSRPAPKPAMEAWQIAGLLRRRHVPPAHFIGINFDVAGNVADAVAFGLHRPYRVTAYEIKVSRSDWKREIANPRKNRNLRSMVDEFVWVCPAGLIKKEEVPERDGLMYAWEKRLRIVKHATPVLQSRMQRDLVAAVLRRQGRDEREAIYVADLLGQIVQQVHSRAPDKFPSYWRGEHLNALIRRASNLMRAAVAAGVIDERARV